MEGALCEVLEGLADPHAGPVEGPSQGDENQEQQHGPRGVDPLVGLSLRPRSCLNATEEENQMLLRKPFYGNYKHILSVLW